MNLVFVNIYFDSVLNGWKPLGATHMRLRYLDGMRGLAIALVVLFHAYSRWPLEELFKQNFYFQAAFRYGYLGVELFIAISGFVILQTLETTPKLTTFVFKRWLRLFPAMLIGSLVIFSSSLVLANRPEGSLQLRDLLPGLLFIDPTMFSAVVGYPLKSADGAFWSLYVEVFFYFFSAIALYLFRDRKLVSVGAAFVIIGLPLNYALKFALRLGIGPTGAINLVTKVVSSSGIPFYCWFALGCAMYLWTKERRASRLLQAWAFGLMGVVAQIVAKDWVAGLVSALIITLFIKSIEGNPILKSILECKPIVYLGAISYPLYLIHQNIITGLANQIHLVLPNLSTALLPIAPIALVLVVAHGIMRIEPPLKALLRWAIKRVGISDSL